MDDAQHKEAEQKAAVERVRTAFPDREVEGIEFDTGRDVLFFVLTSPDRDEWKKYRGELKKAAGDSDAVESAIERCALAMIRYPERADVAKAFNRRPGLIVNFAAVLSKIAGVDYEAREKKL